MTTLRLRRGHVDLDRRTLVQPDGVTRRLTSQEAELLACLAGRAGEPVSRDELMQAVWRCRVTPAAVDVAIRRLRRSIERDPAAPEHVHSAHGVGFVFRPLSADAPLPPVVEAPSFGRDRLAGELAAQLAARPGLVTLHGPGGIGKSHLAEAVAAAWSGPRWWVAAAELTEPAWLVAAVSEAIGLGERGRSVESVTAALVAAGRCLLVLDDPDALAEAFAPTAARWLAAAPELRLLVASRVRLRLRDERCCPVPPLDVESGAALFVHHGARVGVRMDPADPDVLRLVERLDGLPLAIELAAGWSRTMAPGELLDTLAHPRDLVSRNLDRQPRHRSLDAVLASSWALLDDDGRSTLRQLAVFCGSFTLAEAAAVVVTGPGSETTPPPSLPADVERLLDHALLRSLSADGQRRLLVPSAVRAWVLARDGGPDDASAARHADLLAARCRRWFEAASDREGTLAWAHQALPDLLAAARWAVANAAPSLAAPLGALAARIGAPAETEDVLDEVLAIPGHSPADAGRLRSALGNLRMRRGDRTGALPSLESGLRDVLSAGEPWDEVRARIDLGVVLRLLGRPDEAREQLERALARSTELGMEREEAGALANLGAVHHERGDRESATRCFADAADRWSVLGELGREASARLNLAMSVEEAGDLDRAELGYARARELCERAGDPRGKATSLLGLGRVALIRAPGRALDRFAEASEVAPADPAREAEIRTHRAAAHRVAGDPPEALRQLDVALGLARRARDLRLEAIVHVHLARTRLAAGQSGLAAEAAGAAAAIARDRGYASLLAVAHACSAEVARRSGGAEDALRRLGEARALLIPIGHREELGRVAALRAAVLAGCGRWDEAARELVEAEAAAADLGAAPLSELGRGIGAARETLAAAGGRERWVSAPSARSGP